MTTLTTTQPLTEDYESLVSAASRDEWLKARKSGVGASESAVLTGASKWGSAIGLWGIKTGRLPDVDLDDNERVMWGQRLEPLVAEEYERRTGRKLLQWGWLLRSKLVPFMLATPDYRLADEPGIPVEIKTTDGTRIKDWQDGAPAHVNIQCQHQMFVTGAPRASVGVLVGGNRFMWCDVDRDEAVIREIVEASRAFWQYVVDDAPPPADASEATSEAIAKLWPVTAVGETVVLPVDAYDWARDLDTAKGEAKILKDRIDGIENVLKAAIGGAELGLYPDGTKAFTLRTQKRSGYTAAPAEYRVLRRSK
ncbi:MAG: YqaJ viral recombinase family protein [Gemmatimonadaceae bacterium]|nr:YqaJ viral recombinase family protein [Gemmatimonadaceae bacterium]